MSRQGMMMLFRAQLAAVEAEIRAKYTSRLPSLSLVHTSPNSLPVHSSAVLAVRAPSLVILTSEPTFVPSGRSLAK